MFHFLMLVIACTSDDVVFYGVVNIYFIVVVDFICVFGFPLTDLK